MKQTIAHVRQQFIDAVVREVRKEAFFVEKSEYVLETLRRVLARKLRGKVVRDVGEPQ